MGGSRKEPVTTARASKSLSVVPCANGMISEGANLETQTPKHARTRKHSDPEIDKRWETILG